MQFYSYREQSSAPIILTGLTTIRRKSHDKKILSDAAEVIHSSADGFRTLSVHVGVFRTSNAPVGQTCEFSLVEITVIFWVYADRS